MADRMADVVRRQLATIRGQAALLIAQVDALEALVTSDDEPAPAPTEINGECVHPEAARVPCPAGGRNIHRFLCRRCGELGGVAAREVQG